MRKKRFRITGCLLIFAVFVLPFWLSSCPSRPEGQTEILRFPVALSDYFSIGGRSYAAGREGDAGWLEKDPSDPRVWRRVSMEGSYLWNVPEDHPTKYYGMRMFHIDRDINNKRAANISEYDGVTFKYRTNVMNSEWRMLDCMFWWMYSDEELFFPAWNYKKGFANPDPEEGYKEVIIPFYRMWKWGIPQNVSQPCNDQTKFNPVLWHNSRVDGRRIGGYNPADGDVDPEPIWIEIVDFAFFKFQ